MHLFLEKSYLNPLQILPISFRALQKSGGIFRIGHKGLHYPENGDISMSMTYYKPFQGQDPTWERTPFFRLSRSGDLCKTISAVLMINQNGELKKQVVERHHEEDFASFGSAFDIEIGDMLRIKPSLELLPVAYSQ